MKQTTKSGINIDEQKTLSLAYLKYTHTFSHCVEYRQTINAPTLYHKYTWTKCHKTHYKKLTLY